MGDAAIYYYPSPTGNLETIDVGEGFSDIQPQQIDDGTANRSAGGRLFSVSWGGYWEARFIVDRIDSSSRAALIRNLRSLERHLRRGGAIGIAHDAAKAWAGFVTGPLLRDSTSVVTQGSPFYNTSAAVVATDTVWIESGLPSSFKEQATLSAVVGNKLTLSAGAIYDHRDQPIMVRHEHFYPYMKLARAARGRPILTHDHGLNWTLDLLLEEDTAGLAAFAGLGGATVRGESGFRGESIENIVGQAAAGHGSSQVVVQGQRWKGERF